MPEAGQAVLNGADQNDRQTQHRHVPRPRQPRPPAPLAHRDRPADNRRQATVFDRQETQVRHVVHGPEPHDFLLEPRVVELRPRLRPRRRHRCTRPEVPDWPDNVPRRPGQNPPGIPLPNSWYYASANKANRQHRKNALAFTRFRDAGQTQTKALAQLETATVQGRIPPDVPGILEPPRSADKPPSSRDRGTRRQKTRFAQMVTADEPPTPTPQSPLFAGGKDRLVSRALSRTRRRLCEAIRKSRYR